MSQLLMSFLSLLLLGGTSLLADPATEQGVFEYRLNNYPRQTGDCHDVAARLGNRFGTASGKEVVQAICVSETDAEWDFLIRYRSDKAVTPVSTLPRYFGVAPGGRFKDRQACEDQLSGLVAEFEAATELTATISYCGRVLASSRYPYAARIDSFGEPKLSPVISSYLIFGVPKGITGAEYEERLRNSLESKGAQFSGFVIHSNIAYASVVVHYYAKEKLKFEMLEYTKTDTAAQCFLQVKELENIFADTANPPALVNCGYVHVGGQSEVNALFIGEIPLRNRMAIEKFNSFNACSAERDRLVNHYKNTLGQDIRGGLCSRQKMGRQYQVVLFEP